MRIRVKNDSTFIGLPGRMALFTEMERLRGVKDLLASHI